MVSKWSPETCIHQASCHELNAMRHTPKHYMETAPYATASTLRMVAIAGLFEADLILILGWFCLMRYCLVPLRQTL